MKRPMATEAGRISSTDAHALVRLVSEAAAMPGDRRVKKTMLMTGLAALIGADAWTWCYGPPAVVGAPANVLMQIHGGFTEEQLPHYLATANHPAVGELSKRFFREIIMRAAHLTRTQPQLDPEGLFYESEARNLFEKAGIGTVMLSHRPLSDSAHSLVCLYRRPGRPHFDGREARIAHILLTEVAWLHGDDSFVASAGEASRLSPRERLVLNLVLNGRSCRKIAGELDLSLHTVNDYLKSIYKKFDAGGRMALLARFRTGDEGDR